jgi:hypothetical protein
VVVVVVTVAKLLVAKASIVTSNLFISKALKGE